MANVLKIAVVGAGGLGSMYGGLLVESGQNVVLINPRRKEHVDIINSRGLTIVDDGIERIVKCNAAIDSSNVGIVDLLILAAKAQHTEVAMKNSLPMIGDDTVALSIQNGIGCEELMGEIIGPEKVIGGATMQGGYYLGPGKIAHIAKLLPTYIGELNGKITERVNKIAEIFDKAGLKTTVSDNINKIIWRKAILCVGGVAVNALCQFNYGELFDIDVVKEICYEAIDEAVTVAYAEGIYMDPEDIAWSKDMVEKAFVKERYDAPAGGVHIDILRGRKTDIDFKNGAIVRLAKKHSIPTPINKTLWALIKGLERNCKE